MMIPMNADLLLRMRNNPDFVAWAYICMRCDFPEDIIREFADRVNWYRISKHQRLSYTFIIEFADKIRIDALVLNDRIDVTEDLISELILRGF